MRMCHCCGHINESQKELESCQSCKKAFLPTQYMSKVHQPRNIEEDIYQFGEEIDEHRLIRGLYVIW